MGLHDRHYMLHPEDRPPGPEPEPGSRQPKRRWSLDGGLVLGIALIGFALAALIFKGFTHTELDAYQAFGEVANYDPYYNGGYVPLHVNTASREDLILLPMISERIADGIIKRRPFRLTEELLEVKGIGELNIEIITMYLYGFEDAPNPQPIKPPGIPDV